MTFTVPLHVESEPWAVLEVTDSASRVVCEGVESLQCDVPSGVYRVTAYGPHRSKRLVTDLAFESGPLRLPMTYDSPAPFINTDSGRRYQASAAHEVRQSGELSAARLCVFVRDPNRPLDLESLRLQVISLDGDRLADIRDGRSEPHLGWTALALDLDAGAYVLTTEGGPRGPHSQIVHVVADSVTELYAVWRGYIDLESASTYIGVGYHSGFIESQDYPFESSPRTLLQLDSAEQFAAKGEWKRVSALLPTKTNHLFSDSVDLASCLALYARFRPGTSPPKVTDYEGASPTNSRVLPDEYLLRALGAIPADSGEGPRQYWNAAASSIPAFAIGTRLLLAAVQRRTEIAPQFDTYISELSERIIPEGLWTQWYGTEPLRRRRLTAAYAPIREVISASAYRRKTAAEIGAETGQPASAVEDELAIESIDLDEIRFRGDWRDVLRAFMRPYRKQIVWLDMPPSPFRDDTEKERGYYTETIWFNGLPMSYIVLALAAMVFVIALVVFLFLTWR